MVFSQVVTNKEVTSALINMHSGKEHDALGAGSPEVLLANLVHGLEGKMEDRAADDDVGTGEITRPGRV